MEPLTENVVDQAIIEAGKTYFVVCTYSKSVCTNIGPTYTKFETELVAIICIVRVYF